MVWEMSQPLTRAVAMCVPNTIKAVWKIPANTTVIFPVRALCFSSFLVVVAELLVACFLSPADVSSSSSSLLRRIALPAPNTATDKINRNHWVRCRVDNRHWIQQAFRLLLDALLVRRGTGPTKIHGHTRKMPHFLSTDSDKSLCMKRYCSLTMRTAQERHAVQPFSSSSSSSSNHSNEFSVVSHQVLLLACVVAVVLVVSTVVVKSFQPSPQAFHCIA